MNVCMYLRLFISVLQGVGRGRFLQWILGRECVQHVGQEGLAERCKAVQSLLEREKEGCIGCSL